MFNINEKTSMTKVPNLLTYMGVFDLGQTRAACSDGLSRQLKKYKAENINAIELCQTASVVIYNYFQLSLL